MTKKSFCLSVALLIAFATMNLASAMPVDENESIEENSGISENMSVGAKIPEGIKKKEKKAKVTIPSTVGRAVRRGEAVVEFAVTCDHSSGWEMKDIKKRVEQVKVIVEVITTVAPLIP